MYFCNYIHNLSINIGTCLISGSKDYTKKFIISVSRDIYDTKNWKLQNIHSDNSKITCDYTFENNEGMMLCRCTSRNLIVRKIELSNDYLSLLISTMQTYYNGEEYI